LKLGVKPFKLCTNTCLISTSCTQDNAVLIWNLRPGPEKMRQAFLSSDATNEDRISPVKSKTLRNGWVIYWRPFLSVNTISNGGVVVVGKGARVTN